MTNLVWEIKGLFYALISGKASDVLADLDIGSGAKLSVNLVADLTANIPRDVVISAQQQWLPNLATEMADRRGGWSTAITVAGSASPEESGADGSEDAPSPGPEAEVSEAASIINRDPPACTVRILGQCLLSKGRGDEAEAAKAESSRSPKERLEKLIPRTPRPMVARKRSRPTSNRALAEGGRADSLKRARSAGESAGRTGENLKPGKATPARKRSLPTNILRKRRPTKPTICSFPPRMSVVRSKQPKRQPRPKERPATPRRDSDAEAAEPQTGTPPVISIESDVDPESWAEYGGWYRQDYAIYYRPTGHKDKFIYSWLISDRSPSAER